MKKIIRYFSFLLVILSCFLMKTDYVLAETQTYHTSVIMQTLESTPVYMDNDFQSAILFVIPKNSLLVIVGETDNNFYVVDIGAEIGYVSEEQVTGKEQASSLQMPLQGPVFEVSYPESGVYEIYNSKYCGIVAEQYGHLVIEEGITDEEVEAAKVMYDLLPGNVKGYLTEHQLACIFTKDEEKFTKLPAGTSGYTMATYISYGKNMTGYLKGNIICFVKKPDSILHELGHAVDRTIIAYQGQDQCISHQDTFERIYIEEASNSGLGKYYISQEEEYFAECFQKYFVEPQILRNNAPLTYQFMQDMVSGL